MAANPQSFFRFAARYYSLLLDLFYRREGFDEQDILQDKSKVAAEIAKIHAESEFEYRIMIDRLLRAISAR